MSCPSQVPLTETVPGENEVEVEDLDLALGCDRGLPDENDGGSSDEEARTENAPEAPMLADVLPEGTKVRKTDWSPWYTISPRFCTARDAIRTGSAWPESYQLSQDGNTLTLKLNAVFLCI